MVTSDAALQHARQQVLAARGRAYADHQSAVEGKRDGLWEYRLYGPTPAQAHATAPMLGPQRLEELVARSLRSKQARTPAKDPLAAQSPGRVQKRDEPRRAQLRVAQPGESSRAGPVNALSPGSNRAWALSASRAGEGSNTARVATRASPRIAASPAYAASPASAASPITTLAMPRTPGRRFTRSLTAEPETVRLEADPQHAIAGSGNFGSVYRATMLDQRGQVLGMQCVTLEPSKLSDAAASSMSSSPRTRS